MPPNLKVLYEDNHLIAVYKPVGLAVQAEDRSTRVCLMDLVKDYLKEKYHKPGNVFLGMLHRLDLPVSGIVLFAKTSKGAARLSEQFRSHQIKKEYQALALGEMEKRTDTLIHFIKKNGAKKRVEISVQDFPDALRAELDYEVLAANRHHSWLRIHLKTGRPHQIRAQLAAIGHPLAGDVKYGAPTALPGQPIALCATSLTFQLATKPESVTVKINPPPEWFKWSGLAEATP